MTTVFLSGSRKIIRLNDVIRMQLENIMEQRFKVVVGDANGADRALQLYLAERNYPNVYVFCSGGTCRNNVGTWQTRKVSVERNLTGRAFYTQKDKVMAAEAEFGMVLWDGRSKGSINNVFELLKNGKAADVYFAPRKEFIGVKSAADARYLLNLCEPETSRELQGSSDLRRQMETLDIAAQSSLPL